MKHALILIALLTITQSFALQKELENPFLSPDSVVANPGLDSTCRLHFTFPNATDLSSVSIQYSLDGITGLHPLTADAETLVLDTTGGYHNLQFYYSSNYSEKYTSVIVEDGNDYYYSVRFTHSEMMIMSEKPVIYLYPEKEQNVFVQVKPAGEFTFTYPQYKNGWEALASPDGKLIVDDQSYNYLFWEATDRLSLETIDFNVGFTVAGSEITAFLEEKLMEAGLNSQERADFITFWGPRMAPHDDLFLQFHFNENCDRFGELEITPTPDNTYRIYVIWQPVEQLRIAPNPQEIPVMNRSGFTVLEWGGQELPSTNIVRTL